MPLFFFDFVGENEEGLDLEGLELANAETARAQAMKALAEIARDARQRGDELHLACTVRDADGVVCRLELIIRATPLH